MLVQPLNKTVSMVADATGSALFVFEQIPASQTWVGTINCPGSPDTANFIILDGASSLGDFIGSNSWGPINVDGTDQIKVQATGLVPNTNYVMSWLGACVTEGEAQVTYPLAYADAVTTSTDNIFLGQGTTTGSNFTSVTITGNARWRSIWCVAESGTGFTDSQLAVTLQGLQSGTEYEAFLPPYFNSATDGFYAFRFAVLPGVDSTYRLTVGSGAGNGTSFWYGADLANIDVAIYPDGSTALPVGGLVGSDPTAPGPGYMSTLDVAVEGGAQSAYQVGLSANQILAMLPPIQNPNTVGGFLYRLTSYYRRLTGALAANKGVIFGQTPTNGVWANGATVALATAANAIVACPPSSGVGQSGSNWVVGGLTTTPYVVVGGTGGSVTVVNMGVLPVTTSTITIAGLTAVTKMLWDGVRYVFGLGTISGNVSIFVLDMVNLTLSGTLTVAGATDICLSPNVSNGGLVSQGIYLFIATSTSNQILRTTAALGSTTTMSGGSAGTGYNHIATDGVNVYALSTGTTWSIDTWAAQSPWAFVRNTAGVASAAAATVMVFTGLIITGNISGSILVGYQASGTSFPTVRCVNSAGGTVSTTTIVSTIGTVESIATAEPNSTAYVTTSGVLSIIPLNFFDGTTGTAIVTTVNFTHATTTNTGWIFYTNGSIITGVLTASTASVTKVTVTDTISATCYDPFTGTFVGVQAATGINTVVSTGLGQENDALLDASTTQPGPTTSLKNGRLVSAVYVQVTGAATNVEVAYDVVLQPVIA